MGDEKLAEIRCPERGGEKEVRKTENVMEDCVERDQERVGGEWRTTATDRRSWRLVMDNTVREK